MNEIVILFEGYSRSDAEDINAMRANCTCTLIKSKEKYNIIVDTMTLWDRDRLLEELQRNDIQPEDIQAVISTHGHSDHIGNNNLFQNAEWCVVGQCASNRDKYLNHDFDRTPFQLTDEISVIASPGHTPSCASVMVKNANLGKRVVIAGDLFENGDDIFDSSIWMGAGSENPALQEENRLRIAEMADVIIPGHGAPFQVSANIIGKLRADVELNK